MRLIINRLPKREELLQNRFIKPFARHMAHAALWHLNRRSVTKGVAIGLFFAFVTPIAQIPFAAVASVPFRANIAVAALSTLVTNPLTFGPIWFLAHQIGRWFLGLIGLGGYPSSQETLVETGAFWDKMSNILGPTAVGLVAFAILSSLLGYIIVKGLWSWRLIQHRRARRKHASAI